MSGEILKKQYRDAVRRLVVAEDALTAATKERDDALAAIESIEAGFVFKLAPNAVIATNIACTGVSSARLNHLA